MLQIRADIAPALAAFRSLRLNEIPTAARNAVNDTARDVIRAEEQEIRRVFDRPTPLIQRAFFLKTKAVKQERPFAVVALKDAPRIGEAIARAIEPHVPGLPAQRKMKPFESALSRSFWVPSRTAPLDRYGNVGKATISRMIREVETYGETVSPSDKFAYLVVEGVEGIWDIRKFRSRQHGALVMVRVRRTPTYRKRFDYVGAAQREAQRVFARHAALAVQYAIGRRA